MGATVKAKARTFLVCAAPQQAGKCSACRRDIVWVLTERYAKHPMDKGFSVYEQFKKEIPVNDRVNRVVELQRVSMAESHFATCRFADHFKSAKKGREQ